MNFQFYMEKLFEAPEFIKFKKEFKEAYLCSGFFTIDKKGNDNQQNLDYFVPKINKMFSFKLNQNPIELLPVENATPEEQNYVPKKLPDNLKFEFSEMEKLVENRMVEEKINKKIEKFLWSIQASDKGVFLIGTIFISNLSMLRVTINLDEKRITNFETKSFMDFIKIIKKKD